jgi:hypothetical protein
MAKLQFIKMSSKVILLKKNKNLYLIFIFKYYFYQNIFFSYRLQF